MGINDAMCKHQNTQAENWLSAFSTIAPEKRRFSTNSPDFEELTFGKDSLFPGECQDYHAPTLSGIFFGGFPRPLLSSIIVHVYDFITFIKKPLP